MLRSKLIKRSCNALVALLRDNDGGKNIDVIDFPKSDVTGLIDEHADFANWLFEKMLALRLNDRYLPLLGRRFLALRRDDLGNTLRRSRALGEST